MQPKSLVNFDELWRKHDEICEQYAPRIYPGKLVHFRPARDYKCHLGEELKATEGMEVHRMKAYPAGMMVSPFVKELAEVLEQTLRRELTGETAKQPVTASDMQAESSAGEWMPVWRQGSRLAHQSRQP